MHTIEIPSLSSPSMTIEDLWEKATSFSAPFIIEPVIREIGYDDELASNKSNEIPYVVIYDAQASMQRYAVHEQMLAASFTLSAQKFRMMCADGCGGMGHFTTNFSQGESVLFQWSEPSILPMNNSWELPKSHDHADHEPCKHCKKKDCHGECQNR